MSRIEVREVDATDAAELRRWWQCGHDARADRPYDPLPAHVDHYAQIGITMVLPEHRGHSLGLAMKLATHATLATAVPACGLVTTSNADVNDHMNAVNEAMGYRLVEQLLEVQKKL